MRFVTKTRLDYLQSLIQSMGDGEKQREALHLLESITRDIEENYAEIQRPIRLDKPSFDKRR
ncbi:hypothetical protein ACFQI7_10970 [Paenibacillus allorhizosphaerae]|uniref:Uncharacterized protein n=1 Tax=Paenibacillus allorhizosphaerae TaxID=2849866 RepID=A0ABN7TPE1_9BACL|nr:hypothetical protein [Paenibacillus allorhizosphaerae]CAG7642718.1 hypothetical protein PAECIP111802_02893 [Paenibacillus allorhizosphaerae]